MIEQAIEKIRGMAQQAIQPQSFHIPGEPAHVRRIAHADGSVERIELTPGNRIMRLNRIQDLIALAREHFDPRVHETGRMLVTFNAAQVVLIFDHFDGLEWAYVPLKRSSEFNFFDKQWMEPMLEVRELRQALRVTLHNTFEDKGLIQAVSTLEVTSTEQRHASVERRRESMGGRIDQEVSGERDLPDPYQNFHVRAHTNPDLDVRFPLTCLLDPDPGSRRWMLKPTEDSWSSFEDAMSRHIGSVLRKGLEGTGVPVYEGEYSQFGCAVPDCLPARPGPRLASMDAQAHRG